MLDHLSTLRNIWPGHLSSGTSKLLHQNEPGMQALHKWLRSLEPKALLEPERPSPPIGDKPDDGPKAVPAAKVMPKMRGKECLRQTFERVFKCN